MYVGGDFAGGARGRAGVDGAAAVGQVADKGGHPEGERVAEACREVIDVVGIEPVRGGEPSVRVEASGVEKVDRVAADVGVEAAVAAAKAEGVLGGPAAEVRVVVARTEAQQARSALPLPDGGAGAKKYR